MSASATSPHSQQSASPSSFGIAHVMQMREWMAAQDYPQQAQAMRYMLAWLEQPRLHPLTADEIQALSLMIRLMDLALVDPAFCFDEVTRFEIVTHAETLATARELCGLEPSDATVATLAQMPDKYAETLLVYSSRNHLTIPLRMEEPDDAALTSLWWDGVLSQASPALDAQAHAAMARWASDTALAKRFALNHEQIARHNPRACFIQPPYYTQGKLTEVRRALNQAMRRMLQQEFAYLPLEHSATSQHENTVVVISNHLRKRHAIYRSLAPLLAAMKPAYRLVHLYQEGAMNPDGLNGPDRELFDEVIACQTIRQVVETVRHDIQPGVVLFTDIGIDLFSVMLAQFRLAPIQFSGYGHPLSSGSDAVDYFVGGADVEHPEKAAADFNETLLLAPGMAVVPVPPDYRPTYPSLPDDEIIISLAWGTPKIQREHLLAIKALREAAAKPVHLLLSGLDISGLKYLRLSQWMAQHFDAKRLTLCPKMPPDDYYPLIERCHFGIDSYPFGGFNRIIDSLHLGIPILVRRGDASYNRLAGCLLEYVGLSELVCDTPEAFHEKALKLIDDEDYRQSLTDRLRRNDYLAQIAEHNPEDTYLKAVQEMQRAHTSGAGTRTSPIRLTRDV